MERFGKAMAVAVVLFFVALGIVVGMKLDQNTIALLGGTTLGLVVATPCVAIATYVSMRRRDEHSYERAPRYQAPLPQNPPQYWVVPPQMQQHQQNGMQPMQQQQLTQPMTMAAYGMRPTTPDYMLPAKRRFYVIGETGEVQELDEGNNVGPGGPAHNFDD